MHFAEWLLNRAYNKMSCSWQWIHGYRSVIMDIWLLAFILTTLIGGVCVAVAVLVYMSVFETRPSNEVIYTLLTLPYIFFVYNWLAALYEIYDTERMATWDAVKKPYE